MRFPESRMVRVLMPLAILALLHAFGRFVFDPRPIEGLILRPLLSVWFTGLGAACALTWVGHDLGRRLLLVWGTASIVGFVADNLGLLAETPPPAVQVFNWLGVGLGIVLAVMAYTIRKA